MKKMVIIACLFAVAACTAPYHPRPQMVAEELVIDNQRMVAVLPFKSLTGNSYAGYAVSGVLASELYAQKLFSVMEESRMGTLLTAMKWNAENMGETKYAKQVAGKLGVDAVLFGSVEEYGYKVSLHEEPAVSITLRLVDAQGKVLWAASEAAQGGSVVRDSLGLTTRELVHLMVKRLKQEMTTP